MKKKYMIIINLIVSIFLINCSTNTKIIKIKSVSKKNNIFTEIANDKSFKNEQTVLIIKATLKEHAVGYFIGESDKSHHGKPVHKFQINIDGQAATWEVKGQSAKGIKYSLEKRINIKAGLHTVFFALPDDDYFIEFPLTTTNGKTNVLEFKPVYRHSKLHTSSFQKGISHYEVYLNRKLMELDYPRVSH